MTHAKILGHDDVAKRTEAAIVRATKILMDIRQQEGDMFEQVKQSRHLTNAGDFLAAELKWWGFDAERGARA